ncbi:DUF1684 domain-containing protein [Naasia lichenicola]|uniref:DUF1684 domain-containing protein n=1 Tax=Naasia lichenicola TaxID=2565933 RepID=A0A4S4FTH2_9MICO|nr:DUF1684 domain-containing protein [Naasia lichenicola]THG32876.1 DUF1684 domain-containing protein [Naasia lichenicola]
MTDTTATTSAAPAQPTAEQIVERFRARRGEAVVTPKGFLALVNTQWVDSEQPIWGVPGIWAPLPEGQSGLQLTATASDGITVDGQLVDGSVIVHGRDAEKPSEVSFDDHTVGTVITGDDGNYGLRVWDSQSEAIQNFGGIDAFPFDESWIVTGRFTPNPEGTTLSFQHLQDEGKSRDKVIPGEITFEHDGTEYTIVAFQEGRALQLVFSDATSGDSTYSVGRFLFTVPNPDGTITLNFNTAVLPPCAFSYNFNCPMPPKQNRFPFKVEAGEKNVLAKDGSLLH